LPKIELDFELASEIPAVFGSKELIQQILINLLLNAADAMNEEGLIRLRLGRLASLTGKFVLAPAAAPEYAFVTVQDSGCGISPDILPRIFEPFFTTKDLSVKRGTGLGLS